MSDERKIQRRVVGYHDVRMDGLTDLVLRARGASVMDVGCNRGLVGFEMANNGAKLVHGCDNYEEGIKIARHLFCDLRNCDSQFETVDLTKGPSSLAPFGNRSWDIVLVLATFHKLKRVMAPDALAELIRFFGAHATQFLGWRGTNDKPEENEAEIKLLDEELGKCRMARIHLSYLSRELGPAAIWAPL